jgi:hypothetical protein
VTTVELIGEVLSWDGVLEPAPYLAVQLKTEAGDVHEVRIHGRQGSFWQSSLKRGQVLTVKGEGFRSYVRAVTVTP